MSSDNRRVFILNQGSGTVSVIDSQQNQIDTSPNLIHNQPNAPPGQILVGQGPIWAAIYNTGSLLAVANSGSDTLTLINISEDVYGNDSPNFGQIIATVPVGRVLEYTVLFSGGFSVLYAALNEVTVPSAFVL